MAQTFQHGQNSRLAFFFSFFFFFYSYRLLLRNTRASSQKVQLRLFEFYIFLSYFPGTIHAIDQRNSKQVYLFLLKVLNRKERFFSECLRTIGEFKAYFWNYYCIYDTLLFSETFRKYLFYDLELLRHNFFYSVSIHTWIFHWHWMDFEHQIGIIIKYGVN